MGFLDKVKETTKQVGEAAQQAAKTGQDKLDDYKLEKKIADRKEQLGGIVYLQRTGTPPPDADAEIARLVGEIQASEQELNAVNEPPPG